MRSRAKPPDRIYDTEKPCAQVIQCSLGVFRDILPMIVCVRAQVHARDTEDSQTLINGKRSG